MPVQCSDHLSKKAAGKRKHNLCALSIVYCKLVDGKSRFCGTLDKGYIPSLNLEQKIIIQYTHVETQPAKHCSNLLDAGCLMCYLLRISNLEM